MRQGGEQKLCRNSLCVLLAAISDEWPLIRILPLDLTSFTKYDIINLYCFWHMMRNRTFRCLKSVVSAFACLYCELQDTVAGFEVQPPWSVKTSWNGPLGEWSKKTRNTQYKDCREITERSLRGITTGCCKHACRPPKQCYSYIFCICESLNFLCLHHYWPWFVICGFRKTPQKFPFDFLCRYNETTMGKVVIQKAGLYIP